MDSFLSQDPLEDDDWAPAASATEAGASSVKDFLKMYATAWSRVEQDIAWPAQSGAAPLQRFQAVSKMMARVAAGGNSAW